MPSDLEIREEITKILLPDVHLSTEQFLEKYPPRKLDAAAMVTRVAPSPTGFMHIGGIYASLISERLGHQSGGIFYLRIEDTDTKREVAGATELVINSLQTFNIKIDEGAIAVDQEIGAYGPYKQSARRNIYQTFVKALILSGDAYLAFETSEELEALSNLQTESKIPQGYYGKWATWREKTPAEMLAALNTGLKPVVRLKSTGDTQKFINVVDMFKGKLHLPENDQDIVILKSDGLPTYHFAHVIDDHLMGTTHVIRGDEWLASVALHIQLFTRLNWTAPVYGHISPIQKIDGSSRRKLSKRHDPEASVSFYDETGYPVEVITMYLLNLANSGFEKWLLEHPQDNLENYPLSVEELRKGAGALLDLQKIDSFGREFISGLSAAAVYDRALIWAKKYDKELAAEMEANKDYTINIFNIERTGDKVRKDLAKWSDLRESISFFFDNFYNPELAKTELASINSVDIESVSAKIRAEYNPTDTKDEWMSRLRAISIDLGYAPDNKSLKTSPQDYKGGFGDMAKIIRILLVGKNQSPDLYEVMQVMGQERVVKRLQIS
jgi:glutamyl-tRNA synthetase